MESSLAHVRLLAEGDGSAGGSTFGLLLTVLFFASAWRVFSKAGRAGWAALVPGYNLLVALRIADKPLWWILLFLIPGVNFVASILLGVAFARKFGQSALFGVGLTFLPFVFLPILGFGASTYAANR